MVNLRLCYTTTRVTYANAKGMHSHRRHYSCDHPINHALANAKGMHSQGMHSHTSILCRTSYVVRCMEEVSLTS